MPAKKLIEPVCRQISNTHTALMDCLKMRIIATTILALLGLNVAQAQVTTRPASFLVEEQKDHIASRTGWPSEVRGETELTLTCFTIVKANGKMDDTGCIWKNNFEQAFTAALAKGAKRARMVPAIVDGKATPVYVQFRAKFEGDTVKKEPLKKPAEGEEEMSKREIRKEEKRLEAEAIARANRRVTLVLNPGYKENVDAYGENHIAGQRVVRGKEPWMDACPKRAKFTVLARSFLSETGEAASPSIEHAAGVLPTATCQNAIKETLLASRFTPAIADGIAVPSTYVEFFGN